MPYVLDSDCVIQALQGDERVIALLDSLAEEEVSISVITYLEVYQGVYSASDPIAAQQKFESFIEGYYLVSVGPEIAQRCAMIRAHLKKHGKQLRSRSLDLIIAATAVHIDSILITRNTRDYLDIPKLKLFGWETNI